MAKIFNKLVRDGIPAIIRADGRVCKIEILDDANYKLALMAKLLEEVQEVQTAKPDELITEIADLYEVIDALLEACSLSKEIILRQQNVRRATRGSFKGRIKLISID